MKVGEAIKLIEADAWLAGCVSVGETRDELLHLIREAIQFHLEGLRENGESIPEPLSSAEYVEVIAA